MPSHHFLGVPIAFPEIFCSFRHKKLSLCARCRRSPYSENRGGSVQVPEENSRKIPDCCKINLSWIATCIRFQDLGTRESKPAANLGSTLPGTLSTPSVSFFWNRQLQPFRKILMSVKFVFAIPGPEMAAPILWAPGKMRSFCRKNHVHKIPRFRGGGGYLGLGGGGGKCRFYFYGREDFSEPSRVFWPTWFQLGLACARFLQALTRPPHNILIPNLHRENLNGRLLYGHWTMAQIKKRFRTFSPVFVCFGPFSNFSARFRTF